MTRAEAVALLRGEAFKVCAVDLCDNSCEDCYEALYMAIEALEEETLQNLTKPNKSDLISRKDAIDALDERIRANGYSNVALVSELNRSIGYLMRLPSAQPEPKRGEWYIREYEFFTCDQCGEDVLSFAECTSEAKRKLDNGDFPNYCPNCGARMESDEE